MAFDELKHIAQEAAQVVIPKLFTFTAAGNLLIAGLTVKELISVATAASSLLFLWVVSVLTIRQKRLAIKKQEMELRQMAKGDDA